MQAAVTRETAAGAVLGEAERLTPEQALALFTSAAQAPGGPPRQITAGANADLCLLDRPWSRARNLLDGSLVAATIARGRVVWRRQ
jgi:predicted amidohydrolase YtcJ